MRVTQQPLIAVNDVERSSTWYQHLFGLTSGHGGPEYERLMLEDDFVMQLHAWDVDDHPNLVDAASAPVGHGIVLWFRVDDFDATVERATELGATILEDVHINPNAQHRELWLRDLDGYVVGIASRQGDIGQS
jgi:predicted enzyme related to lactoylglutathione lyase